MAALVFLSTCLRFIFTDVMLIIKMQTKFIGFNELPLHLMQFFIQLFINTLKFLEVGF